MKTSRYPLPIRHAELVSASISPPAQADQVEEWTLKQVQGDGFNLNETR
jgi:hypothetical protein